MLKTRLVLIFVGLLFCQSLYSQSDPPKKTEAYKFAEFGTISKADLNTKIKEFRSLLNRDRESQGYVINYGTPPLIRSRRSLLLNAAGGFWWRCDYDCPRVTWVDGPSAPKIRTVMWIVPSGADSPQP